MSDVALISFPHQARPSVRTRDARSDRSDAFFMVSGMPSALARQQFGSGIAADSGRAVVSVP
ncbi:hypothetical protein [uncultured Methylobacterium sp.]|uniref:hypothetical protein n=1 Tax=uncultured Methylobacterium sp. TaxID=157278 RepID=UPI0035CBEF3B